MRSAKIDGPEIKRLRGLRGLSQEGLRERAKLSKKTIEDIENNRHPVFLETVRRIADALDTQVKNLLVPGKPSPEGNGKPRPVEEGVEITSVLKSAAFLVETL
jgi:transcriptional regulator with XRE-family HTH domain